MINSTFLSFPAAKNLILQQIPSPVDEQLESIELHAAVNRIVAKAIISPMNIPSFNNSAMDGYVIRESDLNNSQTLPIAGSIFAGQQNHIDWPANTCLRIMTGAPVPKDAYAVIMQENVTKLDDAIQFDATKIKANQNIRYIGESVRSGEEVFTIGEKLTIPKLATLATLGINKITVFKPVKVAIFSTGDELTPIGNALPSANSIYDSNRFTIKLMLKALGCEVIDFGIIKDDLDLISQTLKQASLDADIVITSGGVSVGDADYTKMALAAMGEINFWKIAMKPGKPFAFGKMGKALFCGLPGNPVSALVTFYQLVRPLILGFSQQEVITNTLSVKTTSNLKKTVGRLDFQRGYLHTNSANELVVSSAGDQGSHITSSFNHANCFIILEQDRGNVVVDEFVTVEMFDGCLI